MTPDIMDSIFCLAVACAEDLSPVKYTRGSPAKPLGDAERRPASYEVEVYSFPQGWGSTALGFGGIGGQAITSAQTTVCVGPNGDAAVYFGRRLAYRVKRPNSVFMSDIGSQNMAECGRQSKYEAA